MPKTRKTAPGHLCDRGFSYGCKLGGFGVDLGRMLKSKYFLQLGILLTVVAILLAIVTVEARSKDFLLELTVTTDKQEEFTQYIELDDKEFRNLRNDPNNEIKEYLVEARRKYADEIGYRKEIYGAENYKMVVIASYRYIVKEKSSGRVLLSK